MDLFVALVVIVLAYMLIVSLKVSLWTLLLVVAIVALVVWILRNTRRV